MDKIIFTRLELYNLVWKFPLVQIAKHYEISTMEIKNACEKMQILLPNNRHWNKPEYKRMKTPKLSSDYTGIHQIYILKKRYEIQLRQTSKSTPLLDLVQKIKKDLDSLLIVGQKLENPVKIVSVTHEYLKNKTLEEASEVDKLNILNLNVSQKNIDRALLFMNAFFKLLENRGHQLIKGNNGADTIVFTNGVEINIDLREALKRIKVDGKRETSEYVFTDELIFRAKRESIKKEWRDGQVLLEYKLALILAKLEFIADIHLKKM